MTASHNAGPQITYGAAGPGAFTGSGTTGQNQEAGPSVTYQGDGLLDPRQPYYPGITGVGKIKAHLDTPYIRVVDAVPAALGVAKLAAGQATTAAAPLTLVSVAAAGIQPKIQIIPFGASQQVTSQVGSLIGLDMGNEQGSITSGLKVVTALTDTKKFYVGQPIFIAGAGAGGVPLFTTVASIVSATSITVNDAAGTTVTTLAVGTCNDALTGCDPYLVAGHGRFFDPTQGIARNVTISSNAGSSANVVTVVGYDIYGVRMTEAISFAGGAVTTSGKKAFKYIQSITPATTDAGHLMSAGTGDVYGFNVRNDKFEDVNIFWNAGFITANTGWLAGVLTSPATTTTGDVRGTYAVQSASDGAKRLAVFISLPLFNLVNATPANFESLYGVAQA